MLCRCLFVSILLSVVFSVSANTVSADVWQCTVEGKSTIYTETPTSGLRGCAKFGGKPIAFNKLPADAFAALGPKVPQLPPSAIEAPQFLDEPAEAPFATWNAREEVTEPSKANSLRGRYSCRLKGSARAARGGNARLIITRGAASSDELKIRLLPNFRNTAWEALLKGRCRNPTVVARYE
jgi:hypothetical protein